MKLFTSVSYWTGTPKGRLITSLFLSIPPAITMSFCLNTFWLDGYLKQVQILFTSLAGFALFFWLLLRAHKPSYDDRTISTIKLVFTVLMAFTLSLPAYQTVRSKLLSFNPYEITINVHGNRQAEGVLGLKSVSLENANRNFQAARISPVCQSAGFFVHARNGEICEITYLVPVLEGYQDKLVIVFDEKNSNGQVDVSTPMGGQSYQFPSPGTDPNEGIFTINLRSLRQRQYLPLFFLAWSALFNVLFCLLGVLSHRLRLPNAMLHLSRQKWAALILLTFVLLSFTHANARFGSAFKQELSFNSDVGNIASYVAAADHPENFAHDELLSDPSNYSEYYAFHRPLIQFIAKITGTYPSAFLLLIAPVTFLHLLAYYLLGHELLKNQHLAFVFAIVTAMLVSVPLDNFGLGEDILPRTLFEALLPFALLLLLKVRLRQKLYPLVSLAFTLLLYVHPVSGPAWVGVCMATLLYYSIQQSGHSWGRSFVPALLVFLVGVIPFLGAYFPDGKGAMLSSELMQAISSYRYSVVTLSILQLYLDQVLNWLSVHWSLFSMSLLAFVVVVRNLIAFLRSKGRPKDEEGFLLALWWVVLITVAILIPLTDEAIAKVRGGELLLREIRRTLRYYVPMLWLTFLWVCARALQYAKSTSAQRQVNPLIVLAITLMIVLYGASTKIWRNPLVVRALDCILAGEVICRPTEETLAKYEFYTELSNKLSLKESVFPDPSPNYLADSLIPRFYSLRSVVYTYKDGGAVGAFLPEWWRITQELEPLLPRDGQPLDAKVLEVARSAGADYFYFIQPASSLSIFLSSQDIVFQNSYGTLIRLH